MQYVIRFLNPLVWQTFSPPLVFIIPLYCKFSVWHFMKLEQLHLSRREHKLLLFYCDRKPAVAVALAFLLLLLIFKQKAFWETCGHGANGKSLAKSQQMPG